VRVRLEAEAQMGVIAPEEVGHDAGRRQRHVADALEIVLVAAGDAKREAGGVAKLVPAPEKVLRAELQVARSRRIIAAAAPLRPERQRGEALVDVKTRVEQGDEEVHVPTVGDAVRT